MKTGYFNREVKDISEGKAVSIVIPTFNRIELLELTLLSLYRQSIPPQKYEVIVVDDCSTDQTQKVLKRMQPPYRLVVLRNNTNRGAAYSRNQGIKASNGEIIIFMDEMLVDRDYIKGHLSHHRSENMVITTHYNGQRIFSHFYNDFSRVQKLKCKKTIFKTSKLRKKVYNKDVLRLFTKEDVINHSALNYGFQVSSRPRWYYSLQKAYGKYLEKMAVPWVLFITNGVSVSKKLLDKAGWFDERLGTWMEDWELGYRLYLLGAKFYNAREIACYHQNHPIKRKMEDKLANYLYFVKKHPVTEVMLVPAISPVLFNWSVEKLGKIVTQYKGLANKKSEPFQDFIQAVRELAENLTWYIEKMISSQDLSLLKSAEMGFSRWDPKSAFKIKQQLVSLEKEASLLGDYRELIEGFMELLRLPIKK